MTHHLVPLKILSITFPNYLYEEALDLYENKHLETHPQIKLQKLPQTNVVQNKLLVLGLQTLDVRIASIVTVRLY